MRDIVQSLVAGFRICLMSAFLLATLLQVSVSASEKVTIFAASSLKDVLEDIVYDFNRLENAADIRLSLASSGVLARQIYRGAPADIYISANQSWMDYLVDQGLVVKKQIVPLISNSLVVVGHNAPSIIVDWQTLLKQDRFAMGDPAHVPAGIYAKQALQMNNIWETIEGNAVFGENIRLSLRLVERGDVSAAILYKSDAELTKSVDIIHEFSKSAHDPIIYPMVLLKPDHHLAQHFFDYLKTEQAAAVFRRFGFTVLDGQNG